MPSHPINLFGEPVSNSKPCCICKVVQLIDNFRWHTGRSKNRPNRRMHRDSICRECRKRMCRDYCKSPKGKVTRKRRRCKMYGISLEEHDRMHAKQGGACAICGATELPIDPRTKKQYELAIDHCHATGKVRSLLCHFCNVGLGAFRDSPELMQLAITYLEKHAAITRAL